MIYPALRDLSLSLRVRWRPVSAATTLRRSLAAPGAGPAQVNVMGYDYTGYGLSSGSKPSEEACYADAEAALEYITDVLDIPHTRLVLCVAPRYRALPCAGRRPARGAPPRGERTRR